MSPRDAADCESMMLLELLEIMEWDIRWSKFWAPFIR